MLGGYLTILGGLAGMGGVTWGRMAGIITLLGWALGVNGPS